LKASPIQYSFNAGELSPQLVGRIDLDKYKNGCKTLVNFIPKIHGPISKRPGTRFVAEVKNSAHTTRLISFEYNVEQAYVLEFGDQYIRFYKDGGVIESAPSTPYEISTPYLHTEVNDLHFAQSADVMYLSHPNHPPRKLSRTGHTSWSLAEIVFDWPPFNDLNTSATTLTASAVTGVGITITASASTFVSTDVGAYVKFEEVLASKYDQWETSKSISINDLRTYDGNLYRATTAATTGTRPPIHTKGNESDGGVSWDYVNSGSGYALITAYGSATSVTATVVVELPPSSTSGTVDWAEGAWSETLGFPKSVAFYEDRLWWGGNASRPQTLWASTSGDYENHQYGTEDDDALNYTINSQEVNVIEWLAPGKLLIIGTSGGEFIASGNDANDAITPTSVRIIRQTTYGCSALRPYRIGNVVLFVQRSARKVREFVYQFESDNYVAPDMTLLSNHILEGGAIDIAYQQEPDQIIWLPRADGTLTGMTYERAEEVVSWHRHEIGGSGAVESVTVIPHWDGDQDSTWMVVTRTIDGNVVKYVEYLEKYLTDETACFVDSALSYSGSPVTNLSGLDHLEGEEVAIIADGYVHPNVTVASGAVTLQAAASDVTIGLPYSATVQTMRLEAGAQDGTSQGKTKRITNITFRLHETGAGLFYGPDTSDLIELHFRGSTDLMDNPIPLFTGDTDYLPWPQGYEKPAYITLQHTSVLPCTIIAAMPQVTTYDR
jgi:hypothetical protein